MPKLVTLNNLDNREDFLEEISNKKILVYEDIQGSKIFVNYSNKEIIIKKQSIRSEPLTDLKLMFDKFYHRAYFFFNKLDINILKRMKPNHWYCFEYFPDETPANIRYDRIPKNNLVLTGIVKNDKFIFNYEEIQQWGEIFNVDTLPVIFHGKIHPRRLNLIRDFLSTSKKDLEELFETDNFCRFFYRILNPNHKNSFLMDESIFNANIEKIIIRIKNKEMSLQILNPFYERISEDNKTNYGEIFSIIIIAFLDFINNKDIEAQPVMGATEDELYINLISGLFNQFYEKEKDNIENLEFEVPPFFNKDKYRVNLKMINNIKTKEIVKRSRKLEYIFKTIIRNFKDERKKPPIGLLTDDITLMLNQTITNIKHKIRQDMSIINHNIMVQKGFSNNNTDDIDYHMALNKIKYETDKIRLDQPHEKTHVEYGKDKK